MGGREKIEFLGMEKWEEEDVCMCVEEGRWMAKKIESERKFVTAV